MAVVPCVGRPLSKASLPLGVGNGVLEVVEDEGLPVRESPDQVVEVRSDLWRHILAPSLVAPQGGLW